MKNISTVSIICFLFISIFTLNLNAKSEVIDEITCFDVAENTLDSFIRAFNAGLEIIEIDVQLSKDEKLVIFHDWEIKNDQGLNKRICSLNYSSILEISHNKDFHIPLLNEVLDILPKNCFINIEIKSLELFLFFLKFLEIIFIAPIR